MTFNFRNTLITSLLVASLMAPAAFAQSLISGDIAGTVTDPTHAVIANAAVDLKSVDEGTTQSTKTNGTGYYRFSLLKPGNYQVTVKETGFSTVRGSGHGGRRPDLDYRRIADYVSLGGDRRSHQRSAAHKYDQRQHLHPVYAAGSCIAAQSRWRPH